MTACMHCDGAGDVLTSSGAMAACGWCLGSGQPEALPIGDNGRPHRPVTLIERLVAWSNLEANELAELLEEAAERIGALERDNQRLREEHPRAQGGKARLT